jgi:hypothetical protein
LRGFAVPASRLPIVGAAVLAYEDLWRVFRAMPRLVLYAFLIVLAVKVGEDTIPFRIWSGAVLGHILSFIIGIAQSFCLTPIMIAVHRFILLDEVARGYAVDVRQPSFLPFFGWLVALSLFGDLIFVVQAAVTGLPLLAEILIALIVTILVIAVWLRLAILFPAIAVRAPGATAGNAMADSKGYASDIFWLFFVALLPWTIVSIGITMILGPGVAHPGAPVAMVFLIVASIIHAATLILCVAIASRLFQGMADRLLRPV